MKKTIKSHFLDKSSMPVSYNEPENCPLCHFAITPKHICDNWYFDNHDGRHLAILYVCTHCFHPFVAHFIDIQPNSSIMAPQLDYCAPDLFSAQTFEQGIVDLSPQFVKIYNQALEAESRHLDEIAGIGYRKALEFLVKDYCKHKYPDKSDEIERLSLSKCISDFIDQPAISTLAIRTAWIGNDETHYVRKLEDRDVSDMKTFIRAIVHYIGMELTVEDAASISPAH